MNKKLILLFIVLAFLGFIAFKFLSASFPEDRSEILREYLDGDITQEQGVQKLKDLSCERARNSGAKYNVRLCNGS